MPPYGIINTNQALPFRSMVDMYDINNQDLINQINTSPRTIAPPMTIDEIMAGSVLGPSTTGGISTIENNIVPTNMFNQPFNDYYGPTNIDTSFGVANEPDDEEDVEGATKKGGLADLFKTILGFAVPGASLLMGGGQKILGGIQNLMPSFIGPRGSRPYDYNESTLSTFGRSRTGAEFFQNMRDKKAREEAARRGEIKELQSRIDRGDFSGDITSPAAKKAANREARRGGQYDRDTGGGGGGGFGGASPGSQGPGGSDEMGSF
jgi:hypothetical protein